MPPKDWTDLTLNYQEWQVINVDSSAAAPPARRLSLSIRARPKGSTTPIDFTAEFSGLCTRHSVPTAFPALGRLTHLGTITPNPATLDLGCDARNVKGYLLTYAGVDLDVVATSVVFF